MDHPAVVRVRGELERSGITGAIRVLPDAAHTARAAADQLGVPVGAIANSLVFVADGAPLLVLTSGAHRVDPVQIGAVLGVANVSRADPEFVKSHTGMAIGGVAPVGHPSPIQTLVDVSLAQFTQVWASAGHPNTVFQTSYDELLRITAGMPAEVA
jgi:prolyl-tRNA editing enzyme YbaK/EbsC (Cys-tRNA(Pro) deacylase)